MPVVHRYNPFATRYVASARLTPRDEQGERLDLPLIVQRLARLGNMAAIVGPHGTGKSTLLAHLAETLRERGRSVTRTRVRRRVAMADLIRTLVGVPRGGMLCIDSWEVLGQEGRLVLRGLAWCRGVGLLVTAHHTVGLPTLASTRGTAPLLMALTRELPGYESWFGRYVFPDDITAAVADSAGDLRLAFNQLYDRFEYRSRGQGNWSAPRPVGQLPR